MPVLHTVVLAWPFEQDQPLALRDCWLAGLLALHGSRRPTSQEELEQGGALGAAHGAALPHLHGRGKPKRHAWVVAFGLPCKHKAGAAVAREYMGC